MIKANKFRVYVVPALEFNSSAHFTTAEYPTAEEATAARNAMAQLLLFQHDHDITPDYSNIFITEEWVDGEWEEVE